VYFLAVIWPWKVIIGPTEFHDITACTITVGTKPGILDSRLP
jgi:hypothetical protein